MSDMTLHQNAPPVTVGAEELGLRTLAPSLQLLLNEPLYERVKAISALMSRAQGITPAHLIGKGEACFSIVTMALDWRLSWHFVARHTYQTPGGSIGYDGALVQSILEKSGQFIGSPSFQYIGDWSVLNGKFAMKQGQRGGEYPVATWTDQDAIGLGVIVRWTVRGENVPRVWPGEGEPFWLAQCHPRNSPLWATDPKTQIRYLVIRRFANMTSPGILGGASFDREEMMEAADLARDITPAREPRREDFARTAETTVVQDVEEEEEGPRFEVVALDGEVFGFETIDGALPALRTVLESGRRGGLRMLDAAIENNQALIVAAAEAGTDLIAEFRPASPTASSDGRTEAPAPVRSPAQQPGSAAPSQQPAAGPQSTASPPPAQSPPASVAAPSAPPPAEEQAPRALPPGYGDPFGLDDLPPGQRAGPPSPRPDPTPPADARPAMPASSPPAGTPASGTPAPSANGPTATTAASPTDPEPAERKSMYVSPPLARGQPDYRTWARALMIPKVRQQTDDADLAYLLGDNEELLQQARVAVPRDMAELDAAIEEAWRRLRPVQ